MSSVDKLAANIVIDSTQRGGKTFHMRKTMIDNPVYTFKICVADCNSEKCNVDRCVAGVSAKALSPCKMANCGSRILVVVKPIKGFPGYFISKDGCTVVSTKLNSYRIRRLDTSNRYQTIIKITDEHGKSRSKTIKSLVAETWGIDTRRGYRKRYTNVHSH